MIERLLLPNWTMPVEQPVNKVSRATFDQPHNLGQTDQPSLCILTRCEKQMRVRGHHHHCVQVNRHIALPQAALENQLPCCRSEFPPPECPECYEHGTIVFE